MARIQYQSAAKAGGYRPQQVDERNIARMREETARQIEGMRQAANAEIESRREVARAMKENAAYTKGAEEKNFQIQTANSNRQLQGLQAQAARDQQQFAADRAATKTMFESISNLSATANKFADTLIKEEEKQEYQNNFNKTTDGQTSIMMAYNDTEMRVKGLEYEQALKEAEAAGKDPKVIADLRARNPVLLHDKTTGEIATFFDKEWGKVVNRELQKIRDEVGGRPLTAEETSRGIEAAWNWTTSRLHENKLNSDYVKPHIDRALAYDRALIKEARDRETKNTNAQTSDTLLTSLGQASKEDFPKVFASAYPVLSGLHTSTGAWDLIQRQVFEAQDPRTGQFIRTEEEIAQLPIHMPGEKTITFGEKYSKNGIPTGRYAETLANRIKLDLQFRKQQQQADNISNAEVEQELFRAFKVNPTEANAEQSQRLYVSLTGKESVMLANAAKHLTYKAAQRQETINRISNLRDFELTPEIVADAVTANPTEGAAIKQRYDAYNAKWKGAGYKKAKTGLEGSVSGTTAIGVNKPASNGAQPVINYLHAELESRTALYESTLGFEAAYLKAGAELEQEYKNGFRDETSKYYRKVHRNGTVSYPNLPVGKVSAADALKRQVDDLRVDAKTGGLNKAIQNYFADHPERLEYIANNYDKPTFKPHPLELALKGMANGMPLHSMYNRGFELSGKPTRLKSPLQSNGQDIVLTPAQQKIMDDPYAGPNAKLSVIRSVLNPSSFQDHGTMRPGPIANAVRVQTAVSGQGFTAKGLNDAYGRPIVFGSSEALSGFQRLIQLSGGRVKASDITSSQRSHVHNEKVGGSATSYHREGTGLAFDISAGPALEWMKANPELVKQAGFSTESGYTSAHGHYVFGL
jgi:hypothetical protein